MDGGGNRGVSMVYGGVVMEFKSQICTSVEESKRLLELGLKKETADMMYITDGRVPKEYAHYDLVHEYYESCFEDIVHIPAWSLHRLVEMVPHTIWHTEYEDRPRLKHTFWFSKYAPSYDSTEDIDFREHPNLYDNIIDCIEWLINEGYFSKEYLEDKSENGDKKEQITLTEVNVWEAKNEEP